MSRIWSTSASLLPQGDRQLRDRADAVTVVVDIPRWARWVVEAYRSSGRSATACCGVTLHVLGTAWLERLLLKVGPEARVVSPESMRTVGAEAAARLLASYEG